MYPNLRYEMWRRGITTIKLGEILAIDHQAVSAWTRKDVQISLETAIKIKRYIFPELSIEYLFEWQSKEEMEELREITANELEKAKNEPELEEYRKREKPSCGRRKKKENAAETK